ncbi:MAG: 6-carboxytetrahydropterin synthase [Elusimicrobia bacterium]|nr:6-carboxytetrahydropterin synthase [Elusimicrobiota bacterium]
MYLVKQLFEVSYAHRLLLHKGKCRFLHGHNAMIEVALKERKTGARGMVMDFGDIKHALKGWLDENLDHKTLLNKKDPLAAALKKQGESPVLLNGEPTAENMALMVFRAASRLGLRPHSVSVRETANSLAEYKP